MLLKFDVTFDVTFDMTFDVMFDVTTDEKFCLVVDGLEIQSSIEEQ